MNHHTQAWQKHKVRPAQGSKSPEKTNRDFCIYHSAHRDYTYNENWIARLIEEAGEKAASLDVPQNLPAQAAIDEDGLAFL